MIVRCSLLVALFVGAWSARATLDAPLVATSAESLERFPTSIGPWTGEDSPLAEEVVRTAAVDDHLNRNYRSSEGELGLYIGYYTSQRQGESLHSPLYCLPGSGWQPLVKDQLAVHVDGAAPRFVNKLVVERGIDQLLVLYWYQTLTRVTASEYWRKLFLISDAFTSGRTDVALVRIIAPMDFRADGSETRAQRIATPFAERILPEVQQRLFRQ
jgi:EpsI family protein